jgi:hypothetical protein
MVNKCELSDNRRHSQQAKDANRLGPKWCAIGIGTQAFPVVDKRLPADKEDLTHSGGQLEYFFIFIVELVVVLLTKLSEKLKCNISQGLVWQIDTQYFLEWHCVMEYGISCVRYGCLVVIQRWFVNRPCPWKRLEGSLEGEMLSYGSPLQYRF